MKSVTGTIERDLNLQKMMTHKNKLNETKELLSTAIQAIFCLIKLTWVIIEAIFRLVIPPTQKSVKGEIVLITGAGHGLGRELAFQYASQGAVVVCCDINTKGNQDTVETIAKLGYPKAYSYTCDVGNRNQVMVTAKKVQKDVGDVTILINNAGIMPAHSFLEHTADELQRVVNINLMAHFWTLHAFLPTMLKNNHGHIVTISSCLGLMGARNLTAYCTTKFATKGLTEALYQELRADPKCKVKLTNIQPYGISTGLCKTEKLRFPNFMSFVSPADAATAILKAQRSELMEITIPRYYLPVFYFCRLFPIKAVDIILDFLDASVESDLNLQS